MKNLLGKLFRVSEMYFDIVCPALLVLFADEKIHINLKRIATQRNPSLDRIIKHWLNVVIKLLIMQNDGSKDRKSKQCLQVIAEMERVCVRAHKVFKEEWTQQI